MCVNAAANNGRIIMEFDTLVDTIKKLESTTKTSEKVELLQSLKDADIDIALDFFQKCLDVKYQFGCKRLPDYPENEPDRPSSYHFVEIAYTRLLEDKTGISAFLDAVIHTLTRDEYMLFTRICKKDPSCGVSVALVNRVWEHAIDTGIKLCKAEPYSVKMMKNIKYPCYVQKKEDGARCLCFVDTENSTVKFLSSSGKEYTCLIELENEIWQSQYFFSLEHNNESFVLDGELVVLDNNNNIMPRKEGNGFLTKSIRGTITESEAERIRFVIWDYIPFSEYYCNKTPSLPYHERLRLVKLLTKYGDAFTSIDTKTANDIQEIIAEFKKRLKNGDEGIIVKNTNFIWEGKRIKEQIKLKLDLDTTLQVTGWKYGAKGTKYETMLGSLECSSSDGKVCVSVGSGFSDAFRKQFIKTYQRSDSNSMFVEIRSNGLIKNANDDTYSLFLPRFIEIRLDKTEADDFEMIQKLQDAKTNLQ